MKNNYKVIFSDGNKILIKAKNFSDARLKISKQFDAKKMSWSVIRVSETLKKRGINANIKS